MPRDLCLELPDGFQIWQAGSQLSSRYFNIQSGGFDASIDLAIKRIVDYWIEARLSMLQIKVHTKMPNNQNELSTFASDVLTGMRPANAKLELKIIFLV